MIVAGQNIGPWVNPFYSEKVIHHGTGMSFGLSCAGYDVRIGESIIIPPKTMRLSFTLEHFEMPDNVMGFVTDKSTLARCGIHQYNTTIEPGWQGFLTLEIKNDRWIPVWLEKGQPIAQIVFEKLDAPTFRPYSGKYQNQAAKPVASIKEK